MPILNPRRMLTRLGRSYFLTCLQQTSPEGWADGLKAYPVQAIEIDPDDTLITSATIGTDGLQTGFTVTLADPVTNSSSGKIYRVSSLIEAKLSTGSAAQTIIGVMLGTSNSTNTAIGFLEFDEPITVDQMGEGLLFAVELGFDGQTFYVRPRVLPAGE